MKNSKFLLAMLPFFLIFSSCSNDDDAVENNNSVLNQQILGKWLYTGLRSNDGPFEANPTDEDEIYEFKTGGNFDVIYGDEVISGTYSIINDDITLRIEGETMVFNIDRITNSIMELSARIDADENPGLDDVIFYFEKI